jgi:hypothetical protein
VSTAALPALLRVGYIKVSLPCISGLFLFVCLFFQQTATQTHRCDFAFIRTLNDAPTGPSPYISK